MTETSITPIRRPAVSRNWVKTGGMMSIAIKRNRFSHMLKQETMALRRLPVRTGVEIGTAGRAEAVISGREVPVIGAAVVLVATLADSTGAVASAGSAADAKRADFK